MFVIVVGLSSATVSFLTKNGQCESTEVLNKHFCLCAELKQSCRIPFKVTHYLWTNVVIIMMSAT